MVTEKLFASFLLAAFVTHAGSLALPADSLERDRPVTVLYKLGPQATGKGTLHIHWTDSLGRVVEDRTLPVELTDENELRFDLDLRRAVAMRNEVSVHLLFDGANKKGEKDHRDEQLAAAFIAKLPNHTWWDYRSIMWQGGSAEHFDKLREVGVNAGKSNESSTDLPESLLKNDMPWYVENIATDFYAEYHRYRKDRPYNYALLEAKALYKKDPSSKEGLKRHPSFSDPAWLSAIHDRAVSSARTYSPYRPIFYNLSDESGIAELAGFWDFDFSDHELDAMRAWLKGRYGTLAALNAQWGSQFATWEAVTPETTREAMARTDENYSAWADHKEWMDISFANALKMGSDAIRSVDPEAYVAIEGAQMPGWGGYDYYRLTSALQAMEPYDIGDSVELIRSLNPSLAFVTTAFATGPWEKHRLWSELLHGARGHIIWDEKNDIVGLDGSIGARGKDVAPYWNELNGGIGTLLMNSQRQAGPIAIHYSQASMRTEWMLKQMPKGDAWMDRMSWTERKDSDFLRLRDSYCHLIEDQGLQYNFVAYGQVEAGELLRGGYKVLILPHSSALSAKEATAIVDFVRQGGELIVDGDAGTFDEHSRRLSASSLSALLNGDTGAGRVIRFDALAYGQQRVVGKETELHSAAAKILSEANVHPSYAVQDATGRPVVGIETHEFRNGGLTIIGLHSNPELNVDDLGPPEFRSNQRFEKPQKVRLIAPAELYAYDLRQGKALGRVKQLELTVDPYEPTLLGFSGVPLPELQMCVPKRAERGVPVHVGLNFRIASPAAVDVLHAEVIDPSGRAVPYYSGNLLAAGGSTEKVINLAQNEQTGNWTIRVRDTLTGQLRTEPFEVF
jgi:Beta-galactosidase/Beta-galactosidase trimerisation domain